MKFEIVNGSFAYKHKEKMLSNIHLSMQSGETLAILGPNGIGKTTLLRCAVGILKWDTGKTTIDGVDIQDIPSCNFWSTVSYVPQAREYALPLNVIEVVLTGRSAKLSTFAQPSDKDRKIALQSIAKVGLNESYTYRPFNELSGGQQQLVLIAKALAGEPKILVLDEPESGLDFYNQSLILSLLKNLAQEHKYLIIFNTHYPQHALKIADKTLLFKNSSTVFGSTEEVITNKNMSEAFNTNIRVLPLQVDGFDIKTVVTLPEEKNNSTRTYTS